MLSHEAMIDKQCEAVCDYVQSDQALHLSLTEDAKIRNKER